MRFSIAILALGLLAPRTSFKDELRTPEAQKALADFVSTHCTIQLTPYAAKQLVKSKDGTVFTSVICYPDQGVK